MDTKRTAFRELIRFVRPSLPSQVEVMRQYGAAYSAGMITDGDLVERLESTVAERLRVGHCVAVSSCTSGLILLMKALDLKGEVILPSFTFFATGQAALWNGLTPVFADCSEDQWNLDPADVARCVTERTCAILGVHVFGNPCNVEALRDVVESSRQPLKLLFDAAHAFGSRHDGVLVGGYGDAEVFSLSPTKTLVAGEGGLITTNDAVLARRLRVVRNYGNAGSYDPELLGLNARMPEFNAAMALAGLDRVEIKIGRHNEIAGIYAAELQGVAGVRGQMVRAEDSSTYKDYSIHVTAGAFGCGGGELAEELRARNIPTRRYFHPPLHRQRLFDEDRGANRRSLPVTERISKGILSLPIYESLTDEDVRTITGAIRQIGERRLEADN